MASVTRLAEADRAAFTHMDYRVERAGAPHTLTWREVNTRVAAVAERIRALAEPSDRVAILCPQDLSYPVAFYAALAAGTIAVPS